MMKSSLVGWLDDKKKNNKIRPQSKSYQPLDSRPMDKPTNEHTVHATARYKCERWVRD